MKKKLFLLLILTVLLAGLGLTQAHAEDEGTDWVHYKGVTTARVNVRTGPGEEYDKVVLEDKTTNLQLDAQEDVIILDEAVASSGKVWYHVRVTRNGKEYEGFSTSSYISKLEDQVITPSPTPMPTATPTPVPAEPTEEPAVSAQPTQPLIPEQTETPNDKSGVMKAILIVVIVGIVAFIALMVYKILKDRSGGRNSASKKIDSLRKVRLDDGKGNVGKKVPQIKRGDVDRTVRENRSEVYYRNSYDDADDEQDGFDQGGEPDDKRALRDAIERLQEHDIVYHTIYGEGEVYDNSDVKLIEVRFGNDMRFLKKDQLVARRELKIVDEEDQAIARRRNRRRTSTRR
ncbi:MAG: SH3 domain-containing protein [Lachnospiraceae bacterium]|nr:SH3 domain-containing protein [Lachnospiraceae bacterium]